MLTRHDSDGRYVYVSPASIRVIGYRPEELVGRHPLELVHPDDLERVEGTVSKARREGGGFELKHRVVRPHGSWVWVHVLARIERDAHGRSFGVRAVRDISAQRAAEAAIAEAERQSRTIIELSGDLLSRTDPDGRYLFASPSFAQVLGIEPEQLIGLYLRNFAHPRRRRALRRSQSRGSHEGKRRGRVPRPARGWKLRVGARAAARSPRRARPAGRGRAGGARHLPAEAAARKAGGSHPTLRAGV